MAEEANKPLKFTAEFDSGKMESDIKKTMTKLIQMRNELSKSFQEGLDLKIDAGLKAATKEAQNLNKALSKSDTSSNLDSDLLNALAEKKKAIEEERLIQAKLRTEALESSKAQREAKLAELEVLKRAREERQKELKQQKELRDATKSAEDAEKVQRDIDKQEAKRQRDAEKRKKQLEQESSEYNKLNKALGAVRKETKDLLAEMFRMERQGHANTLGYQKLKEKADELTKQTQYLDRGIKKIDATLGLHQRNVGDYGRALENISPVVSSINQKLELFGTSLDQLATKPGAIKELGSSFVAMGKGLLTFLLSPLGVVVAALGSFFLLFQRNKQTVIDFNSGLLNVSKTTGLAGAELQGLSGEIIKLSRSLKTVDTNKLLEYATVAGQLGVKGAANILAFAEALAMLETASDISGEEGGSQIARLLTLTDGGVENVKAFGDEIVNLGNNFAATESEILHNATRIAQSTGIYNLGRQNVLAYATATKSVGVEAELVGSTMGRTLGVLEKAIRTGKGLDTILKLVGGTQAEVSKRFREDASGVLLDFIGGLNRTGKSAADFNKALDEVGITAVRDQAVIGSLASKGFAVLTDAMDKVRDANLAMTEEFETASGKLVNQTARIGIAWDNLVLSIENGQGVIGQSSVAIVGFFADIIEAITPAASVVDSITQEYDAQSKEIAILEGKMQPLIARYDELKIKGELNKNEQTELHDIIQKIAVLLPESVSKWNIFGDAIDINRTKVMNLSNAYRQLMSDLNAKTIDDLNEQFAESSDFVAYYYKELQKVSSDDTYFLTNQKKVTNNLRKKMGEYTQDALDIALKLRDIGAQLTNEQLDLLDRFGELPQNILDVEIPERFKKKNNVEIDIEVDEKAAKKAEEAASRAAEKSRQALERQRALQLSIDQANEQAFRNQLSRDEQEVLSIRDKYAKIREEARKFHDDPKNNGLRVDMGGLTRAENFEISEATTRQGTVKLVEQLNAQKVIYDEYNNYVEENGVESADRLYGKQAEIAKAYRDNLEDEYLKLLGRQQIASLEGSGSGSFTKAEQDRLDALQNMRDRIAEDQKSREIKNLSRIQEEYKTYFQKRTDLIEKFNKDSEVLNDEQRKEAKRKLDLDLLDLNGSYLESFSAIQMLFGELDNKSYSTQKKAVKAAKATFEDWIKNAKLTSAEVEKLRKVYGKLFKEAEGKSNEALLSDIQEATSIFASIVSDVSKVDESFGRTLQTVSEVSSSVAELAVEIKRVSSEGASFGGFMAIYGAMVKAGTGIFNAINSASEQRWNDQVMIRTRELEMQNSLLEYQIQLVDTLNGTARLDQLKENLVALQALIDDTRKDISGASVITGNSRLDGYLNELNSGKRTVEQLEAYIKSLQTQYNNADWSQAALKATLTNTIREVEQALEFYKTSLKLTGDESIEELIRLSNQVDEETRKKIESLIEYENQLREMSQTISENILGFSSKSMVDELVSLFSQGKASAKDFADALESHMKQAMVNSLSTKFLENELTNLYSNMEKMVESNSDPNNPNRSPLTAENIEELRKQYEKIVNDANKTFEEWQKITGIDFTSDSSSTEGSLSSGIAGITEQTANRLEAEFGGLRIAQLQLLEVTKSNHTAYLQIANDKLAALNAIQVNTFRTANNTENLSRLAAIETAIVSLNNKVSSTDALRRGAGL